MKLAIEKRRRRQLSDSVDRFAVRACGGAESSEHIVGHSARIHKNHINQ
jgi:hypothetical protein